MSAGWLAWLFPLFAGRPTNPPAPRQCRARSTPKSHGSVHDLRDAPIKQSNLVTVEAVSGRQILYPLLSDLDDTLAQLLVCNAARLEADIGIHIRRAACMVEPIMY